AERLFVDLLPDSWTAAPPALPKEVIVELAKRARAAELKQREMSALAQQKEVPPVPVRVAHQPTFSRYVFELPELLPVTTDRSKDKLKLTFNRAMKFDLASAKSPLPPMVSSVDSQVGDQSTAVTFGLIGKIDVRTFREDNNYVVDIMPLDAKAPR